jgi:hypothetical protein
VVPLDGARENSPCHRRTSSGYNKLRLKKATHRHSGSGDLCRFYSSSVSACTAAARSLILLPLRRVTSVLRWDLHAPLCFLRRLRCRTWGLSFHFLLGAGSVVLEFLRFWVPKDESSPCESILVPARVTAVESNRSHRDCGVVPGIWCRIWAGWCRISGYSLAGCSKEYSPHQ